MGRWKKKSPKKLSVRKRQNLENANGSAGLFGEIPAGQKFALTRAVDKFIRESSCRHMQSLGSPCASFDAASEGKCKRDGRICDLLTEKGERYLREYENE
jgi:hypothetical protein